MGLALDGNAPQDMGTPDKNFDYYFTMPQNLFQDSTPPPPGIVDVEIIEETTGVFDKLIYDETGGGNDGFIAITKD